MTTHYFPATCLAKAADTCHQAVFRAGFDRMLASPATMENRSS